MKVLLLAAASLALVACSDDAPGDPDAAVDAAIDAPPDYQLTGEYVDWTSTTATFRGVVGAEWTVLDEPTRRATTAPNGRIIIMVPGRATTLTVRQTQAPYLPALFVADPAVLSGAGAGFSARGLKTADAPAFFQSLGLTFDERAAHVFVEKQGAGVPLRLTGAATSFVSDGHDDTTWVAGDTGTYVLFPNLPVPAAGGSATLSSTGAFVGPTTLPLAPGTITITSLR